MYIIERTIDTSHTPLEWEPIARLGTPEEVTAWLFERQHQPQNNPAFNAQKLRIETPNGELYEKEEWLHVHA